MGKEEMIEIVLNGERTTVVEDRTLASLCAELSVPERGVAIAVNYELVPKQRAASVVLRQDDVVEIVTAAAGG